MTERREDQIQPYVQTHYPRESGGAPVETDGSENRVTRRPRGKVWPFVAGLATASAVIYGTFVPSTRRHSHEQAAEITQLKKDNKALKASSAQLNRDFKWTKSDYDTLNWAYTISSELESEVIGGDRVQWLKGQVKIYDVIGKEQILDAVIDNPIVVNDSVYNGIGENLVAVAGVNPETPSIVFYKTLDVTVAESNPTVKVSFFDTQGQPVPIPTAVGYDNPNTHYDVLRLQPTGETKFDGPTYSLVTPTGELIGYEEPTR